MAKKTKKGQSTANIKKKKGSKRCLGATKAEKKAKKQAIRKAVLLLRSPPSVSAAFDPSMPVGAASLGCSLVRSRVSACNGMG